MPGTVRVEVSDAVAIVTFENAGRLNAIDDGVAGGLAAAVAEVKRRDDIGAMILRGAGDDAFCAGVDLKFAEEFGDRIAAFDAVRRHIQAFCHEMEEMPFPTISLLRGVCYGGGVHLTLWTDFRFAETGLRFAIPAVKARLYYPVSGIERLIKLIGAAPTKRLLLEGAPVAAETLLAWGYLDQIVPPADIDAATFDFAKRLAAQPRDIVHRSMDIIRAVERGDRRMAEELRSLARSAG